MTSLIRACAKCETTLTPAARYCSACGTPTPTEGTEEWVEATGNEPPQLELVRDGLAGRYAVERQIGSGGAAIVYLADDLKHRRQVASPDGRRIAFGEYEDSSVRLLTVAAEGGPPHLVGGYQLPTAGELTWAPGEGILHQTPGNRNFAIVDPATGQARRLVGNEQAGWLFSPRVSPGGDLVAVYWNRAPRRGVWLISLRDSSQTLLKEGRLAPVGWTADGSAVLALAWGSGEFYRLGVGRSAEERMTLPFRDAACSSAESFRRGLIVCAVPELVADVWAVTGFDAEGR